MQFSQLHRLMANVKIHGLPQNFELALTASEIYKFLQIFELQKLGRDHEVQFSQLLPTFDGEC